MSKLVNVAIPIKADRILCLSAIVSNGDIKFSNGTLIKKDEEAMKVLSQAAVNVYVHRYHDIIVENVLKNCGYWP